MDHLDWLKKEGFVLDTTVPVQGQGLTWRRTAKYGAPKCVVNKKPVDVVITLADDGTFVMGVQAATPNYWANLQIYDIKSENLIKRGRAYEHRLVAAWMELSS